MTPFELSILELLRMAPQPLYSMYRVLTDEFGDSVSVPAFFALIDDLLADDAVELRQALGEGAERRLTQVPADLEIRYSEVELDRTFDPFGYVLTLGPAAPPADEPAWTVDIDFAAGTFVLVGTAGAVPDDLERALNLLAPRRFVEVARTRTGEQVRIEGVVVAAGDQPD
jgi:hypothetical protein